MLKTTLKSLLFVALAIMPFTFFGQDNNGTTEKPSNNHYWFVGFDEGATLLYGDNDKGDYFNNVRPTLGIHGGYTFAKHFSVYGRLGAGTLRGTQKKVFTIKNASFVGIDMNLSVDLISLIFGYNQDRVFGLKPHVGFGQIQYQTRVVEKGKTVWVGYDNSPDNLKGNGIGHRKVVWDVPMGIQFEFNINRNVALTLDIMTNYTDTDRLDGHAGGKHYDWFSEGLIGFRYKFRKADPAEPCPKCPEAAEEPNCDVCKDAIEQAAREAAKEAVEEAMKDYKPAPAQEEAAGEEENPDSPEAMAKNWDEKDIHLSFKVGKAEVKDTQADKDEVKKISDDMEEGREISKIKTMGYASPEGNDDWNQKLSEDRAKATADYIEKNLGDKAEGIEFESKGMGSDWDGFYKALEASDIAAKDEIRDEIKGSEDPTAALNQMRVKYPELEQILNSLRVTRVYINK